MVNKELIFATLENYSNIIKSYRVLKDFKDDDDRYIFELKIIFINDSKMENREVISYLEDDSEQRSYKFQWMNKDNTLIIRWDNAPHHRFFKNFPFHWHIEKDENVEDSVEVSLAEVLSYISGKIDG